MARLRFFAGKGGVGKTTCATAYAVACARAGHQTLLVSTDPAPSVGDALRQPLSSSPRLVLGTRRRLQAVEVNATAALERWLKPRRGAFETMVLRGSWFDEADVRALLRLSLPGIDEVAALIEIGRYARARRYDHVIVDTAPTGHTLRMLVMPRLLRTLADVFDRMAEKHRALVAALRGAWTPEEPDNRISELDAEARYLAALLRDRDQTAVTWITLPEEMAIAETLDGLTELRHLDMHVDTVVINRMTAAPDRSCRWCAARRQMECAAIQPLVRRQPGSPRLAAIHAQSSEPVGAARLMPLAREMERTARFFTPRSLSTDRVIGQPALSGDMVTLTNTAVSLLLFGGKGGVGKTTCAAAAAVDLASSYPDRPVLLISTDPAHSLGDVLGVALGNDVRPVPGGPRNLHARELDAAAGFTAIKARYRDAIDGLFARLQPEGAIRVEGDRRAFRDLLELAPPGLDELMAIVEVSDALYAADGSRLLVIDTAPTGHALRLLEMPTLVHDWVKALMRILLKYQSVTRAGDLGVLLVQMSRGLTRLRAVLVDPSRTAFVAVSRPGALPLAETERMIQRIRRLQNSDRVRAGQRTGRWSLHPMPTCTPGAGSDTEGGSALADACPIPAHRCTGSRAAASRRERAARLAEHVAHRAGRDIIAGMERSARRRRKAEMTAAAGGRAAYVYCIVGKSVAPRTASAPRGLPFASRPAAVRAGPAMWLVVSEVPLARYGPTALERTLRDIDRVGRLAVAHESLVEYFARMSGATVVPMKMFTMFSSVDRAVSEMRARRMEIQAVLDRVAGCEEWGVRVGVRPRRLARSTPEQPRSGTEFLTVRKRMRDEVRASAQRANDAAAAVFEELSHLAKEARKRHETPAGAVPPLLDAAFLVPVRSRTRFRAATTRLSRTCSDAGANLTLTGPWPPYNFVQMPVD